MAGEDVSKQDASPDINSPLYIHPSDYPKEMQVNNVLTYNNYNDWSQEMINFLLAKKKVGFVDGSIKKLESTATDYMPWMRCDTMVKGSLTTAMQKEIRNSVKYATTAAKIWEDLKEIFGMASDPRAYELKQLLSSTQQAGTSVSTYYTKLRSIWDEMQLALSIPGCTCTGCTCDMAKKMTEVREKERLYEFLMGLDSDFTVIPTQILATNPTPTLGTSYHLVAETNGLLLLRRNQRLTFKAFTPGRRENFNAPRCDKPEKTPYRETKASGEAPHCTECRKDGYLREGCFKIIGYLDWWPGKGKRETTKPKVACIEANTSPIPGLTKEQYDSFCNHFSETGKVAKEDGPMAFMAETPYEDLDWCE